MSIPAQFEVTVGRLLCGRFRDFLSEMRFHGHAIQWHETNGWIQRRFIVRGPVESLRMIQKAFPEDPQS